MPTKQTIEYFKDCFIGGAIGDAIGAPIEFMSIDQIRLKKIQTTRYRRLFKDSGIT